MLNNQKLLNEGIERVQRPDPLRYTR